MNAHKRLIISDILSKDNLQFIVPIYQREYKWTPAESDRIVHDILRQQSPAQMLSMSPVTK